MTLREIERRVSRLSPTPWIVAVRLPDGTEQQMPIKQMMQMAEEGNLQHGLSFQTVQGGSLRDLDVFLDWIGGVV